MTTDNEKAPEWMTDEWLRTMARTPGDNQPLAREILRLRAENTTLTAELAKLREHADHDAGEILRLGGELAKVTQERDDSHDNAHELTGCVTEARGERDKALAERDAARAEVERLNIEIGRHPATRAWVTSGIRAIEEATSRADAAIRDRNEFAASEVTKLATKIGAETGLDLSDFASDHVAELRRDGQWGDDQVRAAELRKAAGACPECDGSGTVEKCDWPGEHANRHQEPCPRGCKAAGAAAPAEPNLLDKLHAAYRAHDEAVARLQSRRATPAADARQPDDAAKLAEVEKREADGIKLFDDLLATERAKVATMSIELDGMRNRLAASEKAKAELVDLNRNLEDENEAIMQAAKDARRAMGKVIQVDCPDVDDTIENPQMYAAERAGGAL